MNGNKKISVIMGVYNCESTLPAAIESILTQTYENWELIICDDASTDGTYLVADAYREQFPDKIILIRNERNSYLAYSLNRCLECATGELVARMDGDDMSLPERFERQVRYLEEHPDVDLVGTWMQEFCGGEMLRVLKKRAHPTKDSMRAGVPFQHATIMTYKRVYDALGGYTVCARTRRGQDYDLWFRFFAAGFTGANIGEALYLVREDLDAIRRRTFKTRWNALRTQWIGYGMLGFPKRWMAEPVAYAIVASMVPSRVMMLRRKRQAREQRAAAARRAMRG